MQFTPHDYQSYAIKRLLHYPEQGLFLDVGLGKTVISLTAIDELIRRREARRILVIAPLRPARQVWTDEIAKWDHIRHLHISRILGSESDRYTALRRRAHIWVINRENVVWLVRHYRRAWPFDTVVIDELSSFKAPSAKRFRAMRAVRPYIRRIIGLTATPAPNGLLDLWSQICLLDQGGRFGSYTNYRNKYFYSDEGVLRPRPGAERWIYHLISDLCVSMRAEDWIKMPVLVKRRAKVELSPKAKAAYDHFEYSMMLERDEGEITASSAGVLAGKLLQMANGAVYDKQRRVHQIHDDKLDALEDLVEAANGNPLLIFYTFQHDLDRIRKRLPNARVLNDEASIRDWNAGRISLLLAHPAAAGHGLNMQDGGHQMIWFGLPWSLELYEQATGRLRRQGQKHSNVIAHHLVAKDTIDEEVMQVLTSKARTQNDLLAAVRHRARKVRRAAEQGAGDVVGAGV